MDFNEKVSRLSEFVMAQGGRINTMDMRDTEPARKPYRYVSTYASIAFEDTAACVSRWAQVAIEVQGYFTMHTVNGRSELGIAISRDLTDEELRR